jgi:hypothetical protein
MAKCSGITRAGTACKGTPIDGSQWCYVHHPDHTEERKRYGSRGGRRGGRGRPLQELAETKRILKGLAGQVLRGGVDRADAAVANQILSTYVRATSVELQAREQLELVGRLEEVEEALDLRGKVRGA